MQRTTNYGLCQYEGSDKTSYLLNYNDDMLKIDTAIKNAADAASGAGTAAGQAQSTADGAAQGVTTLNTQINGANGLAVDVSTLQGNVGSINSLIGDGHPTTSNQTIIGAINGLEGAVAPREDGTTLANSYAIGEQFARGGSVYTALTALTAGTDFASLVLNTNYKVSDTLVVQIGNANAAIQTVSNQLDGSNIKKAGMSDIPVDITQYCTFTGFTTNPTKVNVWFEGLEGAIVNNAAMNIIVATVYIRINGGVLAAGTNNVITATIPKSAFADIFLNENFDSFKFQGVSKCIGNKPYLGTNALYDYDPILSNDNQSHTIQLYNDDANDITVPAGDMYLLEIGWLQLWKA